MLDLQQADEDLGLLHMGFVYEFEVLRALRFAPYFPATSSSSPRNDITKKKPHAPNSKVAQLRRFQTPQNL